MNERVVERVAQAILKSLKDAHGFGYIEDASDLSYVTVDDRVDLLAAARAAITALQDDGCGHVTEWTAQDLELGRSYESINFGTVTYVGVDNYMGDKTHAFKVDRNQFRYWKTEKLSEFLKPKSP